MKKILVLGATGHLGANTAVHLKESGYDVIAVGHRISDNNFFESKNILYIGGGLIRGFRKLSLTSN